MDILFAVVLIGILIAIFVGILILRRTVLGFKEGMQKGKR